MLGEPDGDDDGRGLAIIGTLVQAALDELWNTSAEAWYSNVGCCPVCHAPCRALKELCEWGALDEWVAYASAGLASKPWWDADAQRVRREWLFTAWSRTAELRCSWKHQDPPVTREELQCP